MTMKLFLVILIFPFLSWSQALLPFTDFNNFFHCYVDGYFQQVEYQAVSGLTIGDELIVYYNSQNDLKLFDGKQTRKITSQIVEYKVSDHLLGWNIGPNINYMENGEGHVLTAFGGNYVVTDSLVVFQETRYKTVNVVYKGKVIQLYQSTAEMYMPEVIGDNIIVFRDMGNIFKVFWRGEIFELGAWNGYSKVEFAAGTDMVAFNDPNSRTFAVFENGEFLDVEDIHVPKYKVARGFVIYEDVQGNLNYYGKGTKAELASFFQSWEAKDDVVVWGESNSTYTWSKGEKKQICNYIAKEIILKNDVIAFKTNVGGVGSYINGVFKELTILPNVEFLINGHCVLAQLANRSVIVRSGNELYRY